MILNHRNQIQKTPKYPNDQKIGENNKKGTFWVISVFGLRRPERGWRRFLISSFHGGKPEWQYDNIYIYTWMQQEPIILGKIECLLFPNLWFIRYFVDQEDIMKTENEESTEGNNNNNIYVYLLRWIWNRYLSFFLEETRRPIQMCLYSISLFYCCRLVAQWTRRKITFGSLNCYWVNN